MKYTLLNNLGSNYSLLMKFSSLYNITKGKKLSKNSTKTATWKLVPGPFVFTKN